MPMKQCAPAPDCVRLSAPPYIAAYLILGISAPLLIPCVIQALQGSRDALLTVAFLLACCLLIWLFCFISNRRDHVFADEEAITLCSKGKTALIPWTAVRQCVWMPRAHKIIIHYRSGENHRFIDCWLGKGQTAFLRAMMEKHGIPGNDSPVK